MKKQFTKLVRCSCVLALFSIFAAGSAFGQYCASASTQTADEFVSGVSYGTFSNPSTRGNYQDFTNLGSIGDIAPGIETSINVTVTDPFAADNIYIYIDSDGNGNFTVADLVGSVLGIPTTPSPVTVTVPIVLPAGALPGETRLRVKMRYLANDDPCEISFLYGEVEDYLITVVGGDCTPPNFVFNEVDNCNDLTYNVTATINAFGDASFTTILLTRSDGISVDPITITNIPAFLGETIDIILDVPYGVTVSASIQGSSLPLCNLTRNFSENGICPPTNNNCESAIALSCGDEVSGFTNNADTLTQCGFASGRIGAWYTLTLDQLSFVELETCNEGTNFNTDISVFTGSCDELVCFNGFSNEGLASSFNSCSFPGSNGAAGGTDASFNAQAGVTYYIAVHGSSLTFNPVGDFVLSVDCTPILCEFPELTVTAQNANGDEITGCVANATSQVFYLVEIDDADGNDSFLVTANGVVDTVSAGGSEVFGPYNPGVTVNFSAIGLQDPLCNATLAASTTICPPANDLCINAIALACDDTVSGTTIGATPDVRCGSTTERRGVWYTFTTDQLSFVELESCLPGTNFDTDFSVFTGSCDELTCFTGFSGDGYIDGVSGCSFAGFAAGGPDAVFNAEAGVTYYILLHGFGTTTTGNFSLSLSCTPILCEPAIIDVTPVDSDGNEITECLSFGVPVFAEFDLSGGSGNDSYIIRQTIGFTTTIIDTLDSDESATYGPYSVGSTISFSATGLTDNLCVTNASISTIVCPPANDECNDAASIDCGQTLSGSTLGSINYPTDLSFCTTFAPGLNSGGNWYTYSSSLLTNVTLNTTGQSGAGFSTSYRLLVYSGSCDSLTCVTSASSFGSSINTFTAQPGTDYYILIGEAFNNQVNYTVNISCVSPECSPTVTGTVVADAAGTPIDGCVSSTGSYYVNVDLDGGTLNDLFDVSLDGGTPITVAPGGSVVVGPVSALEVALISVVGQQVSSCGATLTVTPDVCVPDNDLCENAIALECGSSVTGNTEIATNTGAPTALCGTTPGAFGGVWYTFEGTGGAVILSLCGSDYDTKINVYTGSCDSLVCVGGNDDNFNACGSGNNSQYVLSSTDGVEYTIYVSGFGTNEGNFTLNVTCPPAPSNDQPCDAIALANDGTPSAPVNNISATTDAGEPSPANGTCTGSQATPTWCDGDFGSSVSDLDNSIWYTFVAPATGRVSIDGCNVGANFNNQFAVYSADDCDDYSTYELIAANDNRAFAVFGSCSASSTFGLAGVQVCVTPGETYYLQVDGNNAASGNTVVSVTAIDGEICNCVTPDIFVSTVPDCTDSTYVTTVTINDFGSSDSFTYEAIVAGDTTVFTDITETLDIFGTPLGTNITVRIIFDSESGCASITNFQAVVGQAGDACDPDCNGVPAGGADPGTACTTDDGEVGIFDDNCICQATPTNDLCENATVLECGDLVSGSTVAASISEDFCDFSALAGGVWFQYTATGNGTVTLETCLEGTDYDTDSHVFTGTCDSLVCYDGYGGSGYVDGASSCTFAGFATGGDFEVTEGETYYILIDGFGTATGSFSLSIECELDDEVNLNGSISNFTGACDGASVNVKLYTPGTAMLVAEYNTTVDANGDFTASELVTGTFDIIVKVNRRLAKGFQDVVIASGDNDLDVGSIQNGDVNNSNGINIADITAASSAFGSSAGGATFNAAADVNCSGGVNIADITIISGGFGLTGAVAPLN